MDSLNWISNKVPSLGKELKLERTIELHNLCSKLRNRVQLKIEESIKGWKKVNEIDINEEDEANISADVLETIIELQNEGEYLINKINEYEKEQLNKVPAKKQLVKKVKKFKAFYNRIKGKKFDDDEKVGKCVQKYYNLKHKCELFMFNDSKIDFRLRDETVFYETSEHFNPKGYDPETEPIGDLYLKQILELKKLNKIDLRTILGQYDIMDEIFFEIFDTGNYFIYHSRSETFYIYDPTQNEVISKLKKEKISIRNFEKIQNNITLEKIIFLEGFNCLFVVDSELNIVEKKIEDGFRYLGHDESYFYCISKKEFDNNDPLTFKVFDMSLNKVNLANLRNHLPKFPQTKYEYGPFYVNFSRILDGLEHKIQTWTFIKQNNRFYIKLSTNYKSLDLCYLNVYDEEGYLSQSIESIYGLQYDDTLSQFKIDSNNNLANLHDKHLIYYDSKSEFIKLVKILVDKEIKGEYQYQDVKFCIDNNEKFHFLYDLTIFYNEIEKDDTE